MRYEQSKKGNQQLQFDPRPILSSILPNTWDETVLDMMEEESAMCTITWQVLVSERVQ